MPKFNVKGVSDWPESRGEVFDIIVNEEFKDEKEARHAAEDQYRIDIEFIVEEVVEK